MEEGYILTATMSEPTKYSEKKERNELYRDSTSDSQTMVEHADRASPSRPHHGEMDEAARKQHEASQRLAHPFAGVSPQELAAKGEAYARKAGLTSEEDLRAFRLGAMIAGDDNKYDTISELTDREREVLDRETTHKWSNPGMLYWVVVVCSLCAAVQGMDETSSTALSPSSNMSSESAPRAVVIPGFWVSPTRHPTFAVLSSVAGSLIP